MYLKHLDVEFSIMLQNVSRQKVKCLEWTRKYLKTDFNVSFTDKFWATFDELDERSEGWVAKREQHPAWLWHQHGRVGWLGFGAGIGGDKLVGHWRVPHRVKMTSQTYIEFLTDNFRPWFLKKTVLHATPLCIEHMQQLTSWLKWVLEMID